MYTYYTYKKNNNIIRDIMCDDKKTRYYNTKSINVNQLHFIRQHQDTHAIVWNIEKKSWKTLILDNIISIQHFNPEEYEHKYTELQNNYINNNYLTLILSTIITSLFFCYILDIIVKIINNYTTFFDKF